MGAPPPRSSARGPRPLTDHSTRPLQEFQRRAPVHRRVRPPRIRLSALLLNPMMPTARETVQAYFDSLVTGDSETLSAMMLPASHYVKIGTDADEVVEGSEEIAAYYRDHAASTEDFSIEFIKLDVQERDHVAWFYTRQVWRLEWRGAREEFVMRMTGVLEKTGESWMFAQIHASIGA